MVTIYCIEDINDLKYVGSTKRNLKDRLYEHRSHRNRIICCSSSKLDLDNCKIYSLERCDESNRMKREKYWINKISGVNKLKLNFDISDWRLKNKEQVKEQKKEYYLFNSKKVVNGCYEFINMLNDY
jgi:hypothetical protein